MSTASFVVRGGVLKPEAFFRWAAWPYELVTRTNDWERHCAWMATRLPTGARLVVDVGCGPGNSTIHLRDAVGDGVIGGDPALPMLRRARRRDPSLRVVALDATALPMRNASVDALTFHSVLYLLRDRQAALAEVVRVLRPGGRAVFLEPRAGALTTAFGLVRAIRKPRWAITAVLWRVFNAGYGRFTTGSLRDALELAGLHVLEINDALDGLALAAVAERQA